MPHTLFRFIGVGFLLLAGESGFAAVPTFRGDSEYLMDTWEMEDGLPENSATAITQTNDGYLWFGTFGGLVRFDGIRCTKVDSENTPDFPGKAIVNLHRDAADRLWVSTYDGLAMRDRGIWRRFGKEDGWTGDMVRTFTERRGGALLITTFAGDIYEVVSGRFSKLPSPGEAGQGYFGSVDETGKWWVAQSGFIGRWNGASWESKVAPPPVDRAAVAFTSSHAGGMWLLVGRELLRISNGEVTQRFPLPATLDAVWNMNEDSRGNLWICSMANGLFRISPTGESRIWTTANGLSYDGVRAVFEDREGNIWVGTSGGGLQRFKLRRFRAFTPENGLTERNVTGLSPAADGGLWIATYGKGLFRLENDRVAPASFQPQMGGVIQSVLEDRTGRLWVGTYGGGLWLRENGAFKHVAAADPAGGNVLALFEDSAGRIWNSGGQFISVFDGKEFKLYDERAGLPRGGVGKFAEDNRGTLWLTNLRGVYCLEGERFEEVRNAQGQSLPGIVTIVRDSTGTLWLGTARNEILRWQNDQLASAGNLPWTGNTDMVEDTHGYFWITNPKGIIRVARAALNARADGSPTVPAFHFFDTSDGLPSTAFAEGRQPACARDAKGNLWFSTLKGVAMTEPGRFVPNTQPASVHIEEISHSEPIANGHTRQVLSTGPFLGKVIFPPGSRAISIRYTGLSLVAPEKLRFQARLDGYESEWQDVGNNRTVHYHELPPADYLLHVRAANNDGIWEQKGAQLAFTVLPFFWETRWFKYGGAGALIVCGALIAWWLTWLRHRERMEIERQRHELGHLSRVTVMGELTGALAHELNQPLGAIGANASAARHFLSARELDRAELLEIVGDISKDAQRAGAVIQSIRAMVKDGEVRRSKISINAIIEDVVRLVRSDALARQCRLEVDLASQLPAVKADPVQLQQVLLNLVLNAFDAMSDTLAPERLVEICSALAAEGKVCVTVRDTGHGIRPGEENRIFDRFFSTKQSGMGMGLAIARSIMEVHGGSLTASNHSSGGACFTFALPGCHDGPA